MTQATTHEYTAEDVTQAFEEITATLFTGKTAESTPKLLITAGLQGSGKTYLLEKKLLPSGLYGNYIRLYLPEYREKHPQYAEMIKLGVLYAYEHTEAFVREVSGKIHAEAFKRKFNIVMECAFDSIDFASLPPLAQKEGYQFEIHIVGCNQPGEQRAGTVCQAGNSGVQHEQCSGNSPGFRSGGEGCRRLANLLV
jgi:hypothetical protein